MKKRWIGAGIGLALSALFLVLLTRNVSMDELRTELSRVDFRLLALAIPLRGIGLAFMTLRSRILLTPISPIRTGRVFRSLLVGIVGNHVLPFRIGELLRISYLSKHGAIPPTSCLAIVGIEKLLDLMSLLLLGVGAVGISARELPFGGKLVSLGIGIAVAVLFLVFFSRKALTPSANTPTAAGRIPAFVIEKLSKLQAGTRGVDDTKKLGLVFAVSLLFWMTSALGIRVWFEAFDISLPWYAPGIVLLFLSFGSALPAAPGFVGTYHYFVASALGFLGVAPAQAASVAVVGHGVAVIPVTLFGIIVLLMDFLRGDALSLDTESLGQ